MMEVNQPLPNRALRCTCEHSTFAELVLDSADAIEPFVAHPVTRDYRRSCEYVPAVEAVLGLALPAGEHRFRRQRFGGGTPRRGALRPGLAAPMPAAWLG